MSGTSILFSSSGKETGVQKTPKQARHWCSRSGAGQLQGWGESRQGNQAMEINANDFDCGVSNPFAL